MYETLFLHESSTASREERALAKAKMLNLFLDSFGNRHGSAHGAPTMPPNVSPTHALSQKGQADDYERGSEEHEEALGEAEKEGPRKSQRIQNEYIDVLHVQGFMELTENSKDDSEGDA
jgi:hypothetical protein